MSTIAQKNECLYVLVTGANSGLGFATCCRLIDDFLSTRPLEQKLYLIITTRDSKKGNQTVTRLKEHLERQWNPPYNILYDRLIIQAENLDLTSLETVHDLATKFLQNLPRIDVIILNAGYGGFTINLWASIWQILTDFRSAMVFPNYKMGTVGEMTAPQAGLLTEKGTVHDEKPLGKIFCANVFGHYMLVHQLASLLQNGRVIWISSLEADDTIFTLNDLQATESRTAYESSKRLTDTLALSSSLPSSKPFVKSFLAQEGSSSVTSVSAKQYVAHPGIIATAIIALPLVMQWLMLLTTHMARLLGSMWNVVDSYKGACAPVWLALVSDEELNEAHKAGMAKWGSAVDRWGNERVVRTEVDGWGFQGNVEDVNKHPAWSRKPGAVDLTQEARDAFEDKGRRCWKEMEELREEWEQRMSW